MKIKKIRMATEADKKVLHTGCVDASGDGLDKPPC
jgi:hypothetical protein